MTGARNAFLIYSLKRIAAIPGILFGVILLTFVLFNVVGGSPASTVLGKNASPQALEEFDERNGFAKPLIFGWWTPTRAFATPDFSRGATPWTTNDSVSLAAATPDTPATLVLERSRPAPAMNGADREHTIPLAFALRPRTYYRWTIRHEAGTVFILKQYRTHADAVQEEMAAQQYPPVRMLRLPARARHPSQSRPDRIVTTRLDFRTGDDPSSESFRFWVAGTDLRVVGIELHRRTPNPFDSQLVHYIAGLLRLDFGVSTENNEKVADLIAAGIAPSLCLTVPIFVGTLLAGLFLGVLSAWYRDRYPDRLLVLGATVLMSVNYVVWVIAGQYLLAFKLGWFAVWGFESWAYLLLPVLIGVATGMGRDLRLYRAVTLEEMNREYVRTARAKGAGPARILFRHVVPNVLIPVITNVSLSLPFLFTGSLLLESYFGIPGLGNLGLNAIHAADVNVVRAIVVIGAVLYMLANLAADIAYGLVDPRARVE